MADIFFKHDVIKLLENKHVILFGDSNTRAVYKDLIWLLNENLLISQNDLRKKQESSFCGDKLGNHTLLSQGREYEEERSYKNGKTRLDFYFITRCYTPVIVDMMEDIHLGLREAPDVIYFNSTLWDVSRWGPNGVIEFKDNLQKLARLFKSSLPDSTLVIWATALPIAPTVHSSLLIKQIKFLQHTLRFDVIEANNFARQVMVSHGFDVLDLHFHMRMQIHRRVKDGVHYLPPAIRLLTNLLLTHIALSWDFPLPDRVETKLLEKAKAAAAPQTSSPIVKLPSPQLSSAKPKKGKKPPATKTSAEPSRKQFVKNKNYQSAREVSRNKWQSRGSVYEALNQRGKPRMKTAGGRRNWRKKSQEEEERRCSPPTAHNSNSNPQPWIAPPQNQNWSDDHWPDDQQFSNEPRFGCEENEQRFQNGPRSRISPWAQSSDPYQNSQRYLSDQRYGDRYTDDQRYANSYVRDPRFNENLRQVSNSMMEVIRRGQILSSSTNHSRYMPY